MAAGDVVPRNRPGDQVRQLRELEGKLRELTAVLSRATPLGAVVSARTADVLLTPARATVPQVSGTLTVPAGMTSLTALATAGLTAINTTAAEGVLNLAAALAVDGGAPDAGVAQSCTVVAGRRAHLADSRADRLTGLAAGQTLTWSALAWTDAVEWPPDTTHTVLDLQVALTWYA